VSFENLSSVGLPRPWAYGSADEFASNASIFGVNPEAARRIWKMEMANDPLLQPLSPSPFDFKSKQVYIEALVQKGWSLDVANLFYSLSRPYKQ